MAETVSITIRGAKELAKALGDGDLLDRALRPGFKKAAVIVEGDAKDDAHRVTGKLQGSLGHYIAGRGAKIEAHVGPQPGFDQPRHYERSDTARWKQPRAGWNRGDPQVYGVFEEAYHPFLEPALVHDTSEIEKVILREATSVLAKLKGI